jgi:threonyl-tRNA synthetase
MLVVGEKEMNENKVAIRRQGKGDVGTKGVEEFINETKAEIKERRGE